MAPIDNGEEKIERVTSEVGRAGGQAVVRVAIRLAAGASKAVIAQSLRGGATAARNAAKWAAAAVTQPGGKISMKELSELPSKTGREVVSLDDKDVMRALETNLKKRGVHYAIEREKIDGKIQHVLHVRGDDSHVVADSLERAAESVDAKRERKQERSVERESPTQERSDDVEEPKRKAGSAAEKAAPKVGEDQLTWGKVFEPATVEKLNDPLHGDSSAKRLERDSSGRFHVRTGEDSSRTLSKSEVLKNIEHYPDTLSAVQAQTVDGWINKDLDVDRAIASKWGDQLATYQVERINDAAARAKELGVTQDANGQISRHSPEQPKPETPKQEHSDNAGTPKQKQPAAEGKGRQQPAKPEATGTPKRSKAETAQMQKEMRQKVKARTDKIKAEAPKKAPKLDAPTPGLKR